MTFLTSDIRGELGALFYFCHRHTKDIPIDNAALKVEMSSIAETISDESTRNFLITEIHTEFPLMSQIYESGSFQHLPDSIKTESQS